MNSDSTYLKLIEMYRRLRNDPNSREKSEKAFEAARNLKKRGLVSEAAQEAGRYI